jgi:pilus assembly protein Flp/PilA
MSYDHLQMFESELFRNMQLFGIQTASVERGFCVIKPIMEEEAQMKQLLKRLWKEDEGQDLIEYGLLITLIALAVTAAMSPLATAISKVFNNASSSLS